MAEQLFINRQAADTGLAGHLHPVIRREPIRCAWLGILS